MNGLVVDNFCGGGGASVGIEAALGQPVDIAINHSEAAIVTHTANHPKTEHYCEDVFRVSPRKICKGRPVGVAWFSPDCTHFSRAKGKKPKRPKSRKIRGLAWVAVKWAAQVRPRLIVLENVKEFQTWGRLRKSDGEPDPKFKGEYFRKFVAQLKRHGYEVEWRMLRACDYGAPTSRERFFLIARCDGEPIVWPEATHGHGKPCPHRTAAECIDWSIRTVSIFATPEEAKPFHAKRPLAENTLKRIARGVQKFIIEAKEPFLLNDEQTAAFMLANTTGNPAYAMTDPLKTITTGGHHAVVACHIAREFGQSVGHSADEPLATVMPGGAGKSKLVATFLSKYHGLKQDESRACDAREPLMTQDTSNRFGLVTANLITIDRTQDGDDSRVHPVNRPMRTITTRNNHALVASYLSKFKGTNLGQDIREPLQTITAGGLHHAEVRALLIKFYGAGTGQAINAPMHTVTGKDRFGLVTIKGELYRIEDIGLRMLQPHELAAAQGFPEDYKLIGSKKTQVLHVGNSVPPVFPEAILKANVTWTDDALAEAA